MQVGERGEMLQEALLVRTRWGEREEEEGCQEAFQEASSGLTPVQNFRTRIR